MRDGRLQGASDSEDVGFAVRVVLNGAWGFASGVGLGQTAAVQVAETAIRTAAGRRGDDHPPVELAPEPTYDDVEWVSAYEIDPLSVPLAEKVDLLAGWPQQLLDARGRRSTPPAPSSRSWRTSSTPTSRAPRRPSSGSGCSRCSRRSAPTRRPASSTRCARSLRRWAAAGSTSSATATTGPASSTTLPELLAEKLAAPSVEAGRYDLVIHPSNLWLTIHESIGHATELDRALGYEANYAGTSFATLDKLNELRYGSPVMNVTGDRTVRARPVDGRVRRRGRADAELGHHQGRCAGRLPARPVDGPHAPGAERRTLQRLCLRRLPRPHPDPADGQRLAAARRRRPEHGRAHLPGRARHLRRRRQVLVDRHAALQLPVHRSAVLQDRGREARRPAPRRRLPGDHHRVLELDGGRRRPGHVGAGRRLQLRQGPARPGRRRLARLPHLPVPRRQRPQHDRRAARQRDS